ncbi:MAG TPA: hypothetical protein RMF84_13520 [Polyangiaceae bacterium LLY-WYZ-14_1]|nr:hypothetical protein [Polyangiaceae bacterium LLY-WYZ-14_1]
MMNTDIEKIFDNAEGRYLSEGEVQQIRSFAMGLPDRFQAAKRLGAQEEAIATETVQRFVQKYPEQGHHPEVREKAVRDMRITLRYIAHCYVRDDVDFFREAFAEWVAEILCAMRPAVVLADAYKMLQTVATEKLGPDASAFQPFFESYVRELEKWR